MASSDATANIKSRSLILSIQQCSLLLQPAMVHVPRGTAPSPEQRDEDAATAEASGQVNEGASGQVVKASGQVCKASGQVLKASGQFQGLGPSSKAPG